MEYAVTDSSGVAVLYYKVTRSKGNYTVKAEFNGYDLYCGSTGTAILTVNTIVTNLKVDNITTNKDKTVH